MISVPASKKKNVIWIFGDQHRAQALGCNGDPNARTPNIDNMEHIGVNFTTAVAGTPLCCPFRGSLLTSRYPHQCVPGHEDQLPSGMPTIANAFNDAGYKTAYFGKWHLDGYKRGFPNDRHAMHIVPKERRGGFQEWVGYENNNLQHDCWVHGGEGEAAFHYRLPKYETDALTDLLIEFIRSRGKNNQSSEKHPFFSVLSVQPPHDPYLSPENFRRSYIPGRIELRPNVPPIKQVQDTARRDLAGYYSMIENLDWNIGRIRSVLEEEELALDTHIMFFSDHGDMHGSHGQYRKTSPYEESIRIPFIIGGGDHFSSKRGRIPVPINHVDIAPTTLGLCGIEAPDWMCGTDYSHYRIGKPTSEEEPDSAFIQLVSPAVSPNGDAHPNSVDRPWRGIVTKDGWKYVCLEKTPWLMFNLNEDPYEQMNLAYNPVYRKMRSQLHDRLQQWIIDTCDDFTLPSL